LHASTEPAAGTRRHKRVLVPSYSQSGQLSAVVEQIIAPLRESGEVDIHIEPLRPLRPYPFPWSITRFFDAFPETALMLPQPLAPLSLRGDEDFDLIVLPYQVWFLAPSLPVTSFLKLPVAQQLLAGKPVVTVVACRNMWLLAQEKMKALLGDAGARLIDHVALIDRGSMFATFITTPLWMFTGRRHGWFGLPPAGVPDEDIRRARRFGLALRDALAHDQERGHEPLLGGLGAAQADPGLLVSERAGTRSFYLWGQLIHRAGAPGAWQRKPLVILYALLLVALICTVVPVSALVQALLRPLLARRLAVLKTTFEAPSGSNEDRIALYES